MIAMSDEDLSEVDEKKEPSASDENVLNLSKYISDNLIGQKTTFRGPFGRKRIVYCDSSITGRSLKFIENFMTQEVATSYSDSSQTTICNVTSLQTALYLDEAKNIFRNSINGGSDDEILFTSASRDSILHLLIQRLQLFAPIIFVATNDCQDQTPWARTGAEIVQIPLSLQDGTIDMQQLKEKLEFYRNSDRQLLGCFSAACPLTGVLQDDLSITGLLHTFGALSVWDYSSAAPCTVVDMNPKIPGDVEGLYDKDAIYFHTENFVGGINSTGILAVKKVLIKNSDEPSKTSSEILGHIRGGLVMQLKESVGAKAIMKQQKMLTKFALTKLKKCKNIIWLGNKNLHHLGIYSFVIKNPISGLYLHHKFVCTLFNDLFGIQARTGRALDSRYGKYLFNISDEMEELFSLPHLEGVQPGFVTVDLPWYTSIDEIDYILEAIVFIADKEGGWKFLPQYIFNQETCEWHHYSNLAFSDRKSLSKINYKNGKFDFHEIQAEYRSLLTHQELLLKARNIARECDKIARDLHVPDHASQIPEVFQKFRWFLLPQEAKTMMARSSKMSHTPTCNDRLNIKIYHAGKDVDPPPIGTLDGMTIFEKQSGRRFDLNGRPLQRRSWLARNSEKSFENGDCQSTTNGHGPNSLTLSNNDDNISVCKSEELNSSKDAESNEAVSHWIARFDSWSNKRLEKNETEKSGSNKNENPKSGFDQTESVTVAIKEIAKESVKEVDCCKSFDDEDYDQVRNQIENRDFSDVNFSRGRALEVIPEEEVLSKDEIFCHDVDGKNIEKPKVKISLQSVESQDMKQAGQNVEQAGARTSVRKVEDKSTESVDLKKVGRNVDDKPPKKSHFSGFFSKFRISNKTDRTNGQGTPRPDQMQTYLYGWDEKKTQNSTNRK